MSQTCLLPTFVLDESVKASLGYFLKAEWVCITTTVPTVAVLPGHCGRQS